MKKRLLSLLLALCMICTFFPVSASAEVPPANHAIQLKLVKDTATFNDNSVLRLDFEYKSGTDTPNNQMVYLKYDATKLYPAAASNGKDASSAATDFSVSKASTFTKNNYSFSTDFATETAETVFYTIIKDNVGYIGWKVTEPSDTPIFNDFTRISSIFFGLKDGTSFTALPQDIIQLATPANDKSVTSQTNIIEITANGSDSLMYGSETESNNNLTVNTANLFVPGEGVSFATPTVPVTSITLTPASLTLTVGGTATLTATIEPSNATETVTWESNDTSVATVENGKVTAKKAGETTITAKAGEATASCTVTVNPATLAGSITITGTPKIHQPLTANANITTANPGDLTYQWYRNDTLIPGATGSTYTPNSADDVGKTIKVKVTAASCTGSLTSDPTAAVAKKDGPPAPAAPTLNNKTLDSIIVNTVKGQEYLIELSGETSADPQWQDSGTFTGLTDNTTYLIYTRVKATDTQEASALSSALTVKTDHTHTGGKATCQEKATCEICNEKYGDLDPNHHTGTKQLVTTLKTHQWFYTCCDASDGEAKSHIFSNGICPGCGYRCTHTGGTATCTAKAVCTNCWMPYGELARHDLRATAGKAATCTEDGHHGYWTCSKCQTVFSDRNGTKETTVAKETIPALGHSYTRYEKDATNTDPHNFDLYCLTCDRPLCNTRAKNDSDYNGNAAYKVSFPVQVTLNVQKGADSISNPPKGTTFVFGLYKANGDCVATCTTTTTGSASETLTPQFIIEKIGSESAEIVVQLRDFLLLNDSQENDKFWTVKQISSDAAGWEIDRTEYKVEFRMVGDSCVLYIVDDDPVTEPTTPEEPVVDPAPGESAGEQQPSTPKNAVLAYTNIYTAVKRNENPIHHPTRRYPAASRVTTGTDTKTGSGVTSARTFDAGVALYVGMSVLSLTGSALVIGKKKEF